MSKTVLNGSSDTYSYEREPEQFIDEKVEEVKGPGDNAGLQSDSSGADRIPLQQSLDMCNSFHSSQCMLAQCFGLADKSWLPTRGHNRRLSNKFK